MKKSAFFATFLLSALYTFAQDILVLKDGSRIPVVLQAITDNEVKYTRYGVEASPLFTKSFKSLQKIEYSNGEVEFLGAAPSILEISERNLAGYNYFDLVTLNFSFSYERILDKDQHISLYAPLRVGFAQQASYVEDPNKISLGAGFMVYPFGQQKISYYTGAMSTYSIRETYVYMDYYNEETGERTYNSSYEDHNFVGGYVVNGMKLNFNDRLGINFNLALGFLMDLDFVEPERQDGYYYYYGYETRFHSTSEISLFYRF